MVPRVEAILSEMTDHRARFEAFCRSLTPQELATPVPDSPWTVFDYIAHLGTIELLINRLMGPMVGATDMPRADVPPPQPFDLDDWNEAIVERRHGCTLDEVFAEAAENRERYASVLSKMTDAHLDMSIPFGGDRKKIDLPPVIVPLHTVLAGIAMHDATHTRDILRALPQRRTPRIDEWLAGLDLSRVSPEMAARRA